MAGNLSGSDLTEEAVDHIEKSNEENFINIPLRFIVFLIGYSISILNERVIIKQIKYAL